MEQSNPVKKEKIMVFGYEHLIAKALVNALKSKNYEVTYLVNNDDIHLEKMVSAYLLKISDTEKLNEELKNTKIIYIIGYANRDSKISDIELEYFDYLIQSIKEKNPMIKIVFLSSLDVYGSPRNEICFVDTKLSPNTYNGYILSKLENYIIESGLDFSIIRTSPILINKYLDDITTMIDKSLTNKLFLIPKMQNFINLVSKETLISSLIILSNSKKGTIINLTETSDLTLFEFFIKIYTYSKKYMKLDKRHKYISPFFIGNKISIPKFLLINQRVSIIESGVEGINLINSDKIIEQIMDYYKNKYHSL